MCCKLNKHAKCFKKSSNVERNIACKSCKIVNHSCNDEMNVNFLYSIAVFIPQSDILLDASCIYVCDIIDNARILAVNFHIVLYLNFRAKNYFQNLEVRERMFQFFNRIYSENVCLNHATFRQKSTIAVINCLAQKQLFPCSTCQKFKYNPN